MYTKTCQVSTKVTFQIGEKRVFSVIYFWNKNIQQMYISLKATPRLSSVC